jgi:hypothetical protein
MQKGYQTKKKPDNPAKQATGNPALFKENLRLMVSEQQDLFSPNFMY